jgi:hypothetical protein
MSTQKTTPSQPSWSPKLYLAFGRSTLTDQQSFKRARSLVSW